MKISAIILIIFGFVNAASAQTLNPSHPFSDSWVISGEGGITIGDTDFPDTKIDYTGRGLLEYFLPTSSSSIFGMRLLFGAGYIAGKGIVSTSPVYSNIDEIRTEFYHVGLGLTYSFSLGKVVQPYLNTSVSYFAFNPLDKNGFELPGNANDNYTKNDFNFIGEFGFRFLVSEKISLNTSYAYNFIVDDNIDDIITNDQDDRFHSFYGGVSYYFLSDNDSDEDGVKDSKDMCLNTPPNVVVDEFGCPLDSDNDKIADYLDICPETPSNVKVDKNGCPVDLDQDGIADYLDKCPNSKLNVEVDNYGCEKIKVVEEIITEKEEVVTTEFDYISESSITFLIGKTDILPDQKNLLDKILTKMEEQEKNKWAIIGYADNLGSEDDNIKLSLNRANNVAAYLINNGIKKERLQVYGFGSNIPLADNSTEFGRALNRRVEIIDINKFADRNSLIRSISISSYAFSEEYSVGNLIFTDGKYYCIQVSSWKDINKANEEVAKLNAKGHTAFWIEALSEVTGNKRYRVRIGYFESLMAAKEYQKRIR